MVDNWQLGRGNQFYLSSFSNCVGNSLLCFASVCPKIIELDYCCANYDFSNVYMQSSIMLMFLLQYHFQKY